MPDGLLNREQAAARLGVSVRTLFNLRASGFIPDTAVVQVPANRQQIFYDPKELDKLGDVRTVRSNQAAARRQRRHWAGLDEETPRPVRRDPRTGRSLPWQ